ncbi:hypothetical protein ACEPPN_000823 [Leptodophora sp. 'Broadleaf-Isolate-01']
MAPSKRNRGATLAKSPPRSPIRPITKRPRQQTPEASGSLPLPLRPTKLIVTTTPTTFNSSQVDESEFKEEKRAQVISESESEEEEDDDITRTNEFLDQDLKELGRDRLDREEINESDIKKEVTEEFKISKYFRQLIIDLEGKVVLPSKEVFNVLTFGPHKSKLAPLSEKGSATQKRARAAQRELNRQNSLHKSKTPAHNQPTLQQPLTSFFKPKPLIIEPPDDDPFEDIDDLSDEEDEEFDQQVEEELRAEDNSIELDDFNDIEFTDDRNELLLDSLIRDAINFGFTEITSTPKTYREVLTDIKKQINNKKVKLLPRVQVLVEVESKPLSLLPRAITLPVKE